MAAIAVSKYPYELPCLSLKDRLWLLIKVTTENVIGNVERSLTLQPPTWDLLDRRLHIV